MKTVVNRHGSYKLNEVFEMVDPIDYTFKIIIIGDARIGKTCMLANFTNSTIPRTYIPSSENIVVNQYLTFKNKRIHLVLWDLPGDDQHRTSTAAEYYNAHGAVIAYSMTDYESLSHIHGWNENINLLLPQETLDSLQRVVVGLKSDSHRVCVTKEEGAAIAFDIHCKHLTGSCHVPGSFNEMFERLVISMITDKIRLVGDQSIIEATTPLLSNFQSHNGVIISEIDSDENIKKCCSCC